jgi:hypothetical protein
VTVPAGDTETVGGLPMAAEGLRDHQINRDLSLPFPSQDDKSLRRHWPPMSDSTGRWRQRKLADRPLLCADLGCLHFAIGARYLGGTFSPRLS